MAQLDDVHSVLRLNYETPKGLISLAPPSVAKPTPYATVPRRDNRRMWDDDKEEREAEREAALDALEKAMLPATLAERERCPTCDKCQKITTASGVRVRHAASRLNRITTARPVIMCSLEKIG